MHHSHFPRVSSPTSNDWMYVYASYYHTRLEIGFGLSAEGLSIVLAFDSPSD